MKKFILYPLIALFSLVLLPIIILALAIFFDPDAVINVKTLKIALEKTTILKEWSWREGSMDFEWNKWNDRNFKGSFQDFCFVYESEGMDVNTCLEQFSWNFNFVFFQKGGFQINSLSPLVVKSEKTKVSLKETPSENEKTSPPDIWGYWQILWQKKIPDMNLSFKEIEVVNGKETNTLGFSLVKEKELLFINSMEFRLIADPQKIELIGPDKYKLPGEPIPGNPLYLRDFKLSAPVTSKKIPITVTGSVDVIDFLLNAKLELPIKHDISSVKFRKLFFLTLTGNVKLNNLQKNFSRFSTDKYSVLPAPLNVMDGSIITNIKSQNIKDTDSVLFKAKTDFNLKSEKQVLDLIITTDVPVNVEDFSPGAIVVDIDFRKVTLQLPRISKKSAPPQFMPDGRIQNTPFNPEEKTKKEKEAGIDLTMEIQALNEKALHLRTNLLDEALRLNFDLFIKQGTLEKGFVKALPLKTKIFKRPIHLKSMQINFDAPRDPVLEGTIQFPLPEYKITLNLEGPVSDPRYSFSSEPPLPQNDIYAVLLFGRPLSDLSPDDKTAAQRTNQMLAQGILSLSVLYFLAGSPVEYVGYDPESKQATAQIGLGSKNSLRVGAGSGGSNSTGVRRSLGKGWYLDTSTERNESSLSESNSRNYGVMLERIIAY